MQIENETRAAMLNQFSALVSSPRWMRSPPGNMMRGVDFYTFPDLVEAILFSAQVFKNVHGYMPNLISPTSFNEHIYARKFLAPLSVPSLADKLHARDYVREKVGDHILTSVSWIGDIEHLFTDEIPAGTYFLKSNTGSGQNFLLNLPHDLTEMHELIHLVTQVWREKRYGLKWGEWQYSTFEQKLFLETFIDFCGDAGPDNYKFFCFKGKVRLISVISDETKSMYSPSWEPVDALYAGFKSKFIEEPENLSELIRVAEKISEDLDFARIDLYTDTKSIIKFGEITLTPGNANQVYSNFRFDRNLGKFFKA